MAKSDKTSSASDPKIIFNVEGLSKEQQTAIFTYIETVINIEMQNLLHHVKMREKIIMDALETMQNSQTFCIKELNMKIGALTGARTKKEKEPEPIFSSVEDAIAYSNRKRRELGLPEMKDEKTSSNQEDNIPSS